MAGPAVIVVEPVVLGGAALLVVSAGALGLMSPAATEARLKAIRQAHEAVTGAVSDAWEGTKQTIGDAWNSMFGDAAGDITSGSGVLGGSQASTMATMGNEAQAGSQANATSEPKTDAQACQGCAAASGGDGGDDGKKGEDEKPELEKNPKHHPNAKGKASPEPADAAEVYKGAKQGPDGNWYGKNQNGDIYRYSRSSNGKTHWNGSTVGPNGIPSNRIPNTIKKGLGVNLK